MGLMSDDYAYEERMAICVHDGGVTEDEARIIACTQTRRPIKPTKEQALRQWMDTAMERFGRNAQKSASRLMRHHGVSTMDELTVDQLMGSVERMRES